MFRFLISLPTRDNDFQLAQARSAEETARRLGIQVEIIYAENDSVNQSTQVLRAIQKQADTRPSAVVLEPVSGTGLPQVAQAACSAAVGWAVLNRHPDYLAALRRSALAPMFCVTSNHLEIGRIQGRQFAAMLPRGGSVLYIEGPSHSTSAQKRTAGMLEAKPANVQVAMLKGRWTESSGLHAVRSWLKLATSQSASIDLIAAQDDSMAMGARKAFEELPANERARWLALPFAGCDGQEATGQVWLREGSLTATVYIPPITGPAIEILTQALNEKSQPAEHSLTKSFSIPPLETLSLRSIKK
jgi:ribose transport system substrate-binding protein